LLVIALMLVLNNLSYYILVDYIYKADDLWEPVLRDRETERQRDRDRETERVSNELIVHRVIGTF
jgi:hypothetical protein